MSTVLNLILSNVELTAEGNTADAVVVLSLEGPPGPAGGGGPPQWLTGHGAPPSGDGMLPLDGINDPWRWWGYGGSWVAQAYEVTVTAGAVLDLSGVSLPAGTAEVDVYGTSATTLHDAASDASFRLLGNAYCTFGGPSGTASSDGTGIAFIAQYETDYAGPTAVPDPTLAVADYLGAGFTIGAPYTFPAVDLGVDGDFYLDLDSHNVYAKTAGVWAVVGILPASLPAGFDPGSDQAITGQWSFAPGPILTSPSSVLYRLVVADDGTLSTVAV